MLVIGPVSIHVGSTVDQPGAIEGDGITEDGGQEIGIPQTLSPDVPGHHRGEHKAQEHHGDLIVPRKQDIMSLLGTHRGDGGGDRLNKFLRKQKQKHEEPGPVSTFSSFCMRRTSLSVTLYAGPQTHTPTKVRQVTPF